MSEDRELSYKPTAAIAALFALVLTAAACAAYHHQHAMPARHAAAPARALAVTPAADDFKAKDKVVVFCPTPDLVTDLYEAIFSHVETSEERTSMGGIVVALTSNRRQDFEMAQYVLTERAPAFLRRQPRAAPHPYGSPVPAG